MLGCAKNVQLAVVFLVGECGVSFEFILKPAKNLNALCHDAGLYIKWSLITLNNNN